MCKLVQTRALELHTVAVGANARHYELARDDQGAGVELVAHETDSGTALPPTDDIEPALTLGSHGVHVRVAHDQSKPNGRKADDMDANRPLHGMQRCLIRDDQRWIISQSFHMTIIRNAMAQCALLGIKEQALAETHFGYI
jgi:hypothetical protein